MAFISRIKKRIGLIYGRHIKRDPFVIEVQRWFKDKGDETLRLAYPLDERSIVFDVGGYLGDFAAEIQKRYGCTVYIFEPVAEFHRKCCERFAHDPKIVCLNYGLSSQDGFFDIDLADNASSFGSPHATGQTERVEVRSVVDCIRDLDVKQIDLMKINIEGGEFEVLPALIESGDIRKVGNLQVQFHNFVDLAVPRRDSIRALLAETHKEDWNYEFVWEGWSRAD